MLESKLDRFKSGYTTCSKLISDYVRCVRNEKPKDSKGTHMIRVAAMDDLDPWEGAGYCTSIFLNFFKRPKTVYKLISGK